MPETIAATDDVSSRPTRAAKPDASALNWLPILQSPQDQIRLLYMFEGTKDDCIVCRLETWDRKSAPSYNAVSYTYGEEKNHKSLQINGVLCNVRSNAHYALLQVRLHQPGSYVWIDSICIDQRDLEEKSQQVAMMAEIYMSAAVTYACVGPAATNSDLLSEFFKDLGSIELVHEDLRERWGHTEVRNPSSRVAISDSSDLTPFAEFWKSWCLARGFIDMDTIIAALLAFMHRPYWKRLWVIQEVSLSRHVEVLYGNHQTRLQVIRRALWLSKVIGTVDKGMPEFFGRLMVMSFDRTLELMYWSATVAHFACNDARDKFFALLSMIKWPAGGRPVPDYTSSAVQLACILARHLDYDIVRDALNELGIAMDNNELSSMVKRRRMPVEPSVRSKRSACEAGAICTRLRADDGGSLRCSLYPSSIENYDTSAQYARFMQKLKESRDTAPLPWREIWFEDELGAVVSNEVQEGDFVGRLDTFDRGPIVILRHVRDVQFIIVGQGFMLPGFSLCHAGSICQCARNVDHDTFRLRFELEISEQDVVALVGQGLLSYDWKQDTYGALAHDVDARFARLWTRVSEQANPPARLVHDLMFKHLSAPQVFDWTFKRSGGHQQCSQYAVATDG